MREIKLNSRRESEFDLEKLELNKVVVLLNDPELIEVIEG
jgi:hypothetical protein